MKIKIIVACVCGAQNISYAIAGSALPDVICKCGETIHGCGDVRVSEGVLARSADELEAGDFPLAIVLAAMAADCELAALFFKWKRIDFRIAGDSLPDMDELETHFRNIGGVVEKLDAVAELLVSKKLDAFVTDAEQKELAQWIEEFGGTDLLQDSIRRNIQERLFWPRNQILHFGKTDFSLNQANACVKIAIVSMKILRQMDQYRCSTI